jgi:hypothetical protein
VTPHADTGCGRASAAAARACVSERPPTAPNMTASRRAAMMPPAIDAEFADVAGAGAAGQFRGIPFANGPNPVTILRPETRARAGMRVTFE